MSCHVAIVMGGWSVERAVSLVSGQAVREALLGCGYRVSVIDAGRDIASVLGDCGADVVFNALHGRWGEDGCVQGILETLEIPYTHSGVLASAVAMHKPMARRVFASHGLPCPEGRVMNKAEIMAGPGWPDGFVVKPVNEGSSIGVLIVRDGEAEAGRAALQGLSEDADYLVEAYIPGRELTVAVMDGRPLGVLELRPHDGFYDYDAKYTSGLTDHLAPAPIDSEIDLAARDIAARAHRALGCRGVSRADFRYRDDVPPDKGLFLLEINTQPGLTPTSLVPESAALEGFDFTTLVEWMVEDASCQR